MQNRTIKEIQWNDRLEKYFADTGEKAHCLSWLHKRSEAMYSIRTTFIDLPVIIISTVIGAVSIGSKDLFKDSPTAPVVLGLLSIFVSVLNTVGSYFAWARRSELHRVSFIQYSKLYRNLNIELSLPRDERSTPGDLLKYIKNEYERLHEISPLIPPNIIKKFNTLFKDQTDISQPEEVNGLEQIEIFIPGPQKTKNSEIQTDVVEEENDDNSVVVDGGTVLTSPLPSMSNIIGKKEKKLTWK
jgi:hypothetical protein